MSIWEHIKLKIKLLRKRGQRGKELKRKVKKMPPKHKKIVRTPKRKVPVKKRKSPRLANNGKESGGDTSTAGAAKATDSAEAERRKALVLKKVTTPILTPVTRSATRETDVTAEGGGTELRRSTRLMSLISVVSTTPRERKGPKGSKSLKNTPATTTGLGASSSSGATATSKKKSAVAAVPVSTTKQEQQPARKSTAATTTSSSKKRRTPSPEKRDDRKSVGLQKNKQLSSSVAADTSKHMKRKSQGESLNGVPQQKRRRTSSASSSSSGDGDEEEDDSNNRRIKSGESINSRSRFASNSSSNSKQSESDSARTITIPSSPVLRNRYKKPDIADQEVDEQNDSDSARTISIPSSPVLRNRYKKPDIVDQEVAYFQETTHTLIPRTSFCRLVKEVASELTGIEDLRFKAAALVTLQEAAETYLIGLFEDSHLICNHANRKTLQTKDLRLAYRIRGGGYPRVIGNSQ